MCSFRYQFNGINLTHKYYAKPLFPPFYHYLLQNYSHNIIEITDKYKYLGIVFKNTGLLKYANENLVDKAKCSTH